MLRLTWRDDAKRGRYLLVEGQIVEEWSDVLGAECLESLTTGEPCEIDLAGTTHVDRGGFAILQTLVSRGFRIVGENPLISEVRKSGGW